MAYGQSIGSKYGPLIWVLTLFLSWVGFEVWVHADYSLGGLKKGPWF